MKTNLGFSSKKLEEGMANIMALLNGQGMIPQNINANAKRPRDSSVTNSSLTSSTPQKRAVEATNTVDTAMTLDLLHDDDDPGEEEKKL